MPGAAAPRIAIVHDWLIAGGAELVVEAIHELYPEAPIYTSYATDEWKDRLHGKVVTGYLQHFPRLRKYVPFLRAWWFSGLDLSGYDLVISSSGAEAKGIRVPAGTRHINYCHSPTHYYWSRYEAYLKHPGFGAFDGLARFGLKLLVGPMRRWDYKAAQRPDLMLANSTHIQQMIKKYYDRDSVVVFPPIAVEDFVPKPSRDGAADAQSAKRHDARATERHGFVITGRQTPYKRVDLAVAACTKLGLPLTVFGTGPDHQKLRDMAGPTITFTGWASRDEVIKALQTASGFVFPGVDDFGISAVESLAAGTPVIAYKAGGALDYVEPSKTGVFFEEPTVDSLAACLESFDASEFKPAEIQKTVQRFSKTNFKTNFQKAVSKKA